MDPSFPPNWQYTFPSFPNESYPLDDSDPTQPPSDYPMPQPPSDYPMPQPPNIENPEINPTIVSGSGSTQPPRARKRTSGVWQFFDIQQIDGVDRAVCKKCQKNYSCDSASGTGHLSRHVKKHQQQGEREVTQTQLSTTGENIGIFAYDQARQRQALAKFIVQSEQPFSFAENRALERYIQSFLQPQYVRVSRNTITSDALSEFLRAKQIMIRTLSNLNCKISLTSDVWQSAYGMYFICITAHWIDDNWLLQKRILHFKNFEYPHTGIVIMNAINECLNEYEIKDKIFSISFDNASNNNVVVNELKQQFDLVLNGRLFHVRCACHIINLCVQDALIHMQPHIKKVKEVITHIRSSGPRYQDFKLQCKQRGLKLK